MMKRPIIKKKKQQQTKHNVCQCCNFVRQSLVLRLHCPKSLTFPIHICNLLCTTDTKLEWLKKLLPVWCWNLNEWYCTVNNACVTHEDKNSKLSGFNMLFACCFIQWENILKMRGFTWVHIIHCGLFHLWMSQWVTIKLFLLAKQPWCYGTDRIAIHSGC